MCLYLKGGMYIHADTEDNHVDKQLIAGEDHFPRPSSSFSSNTSSATLGGASGRDRDTDHPHPAS